MAKSLSAALTLIALASAPASAAVTTGVVDLTTRPGVTQRLLYVRPDAPRANILVVSGGTGVLQIQDDGTMRTQESRCGPIIRNRQAFADRGFAQAFVDQSSTGSVGNFLDMQEVIHYLRARDAVPTWLIGISSSTETIGTVAANLPLSEPAGVILLSPSGVLGSQAASIRRPVMVVYHGADAIGVLQVASRLFADLTSAPAKELAVLTGGSPTPGCPGPHTFDGIDPTFITTISGFIDKYNPSLSPSPAVAIEFYNASLDHYFLTHIANEIALMPARRSRAGCAPVNRSTSTRPRRQGRRRCAGITSPRAGQLALLRPRHD
jgi:hypothetical protein